MKMEGERGETPPVTVSGQQASSLSTLPLSQQQRQLLQQLSFLHNNLQVSPGHNSGFLERNCLKFAEFFFIAPIHVASLCIIESFLSTGIESFIYFQNKTKQNNGLDTDLFHKVTQQKG